MLHAISIGCGIVRGNAKRFPYVQPIVVQAKKKKNGQWIWHTIKRLPARRSLAKATREAKKYSSSYGVLYFDKYGSLHNKPIPEEIVKYLQ
jgi:hypothetical protein